MIIQGASNQPNTGMIDAGGAVVLASWVVLLATSLLVMSSLVEACRSSKASTAIFLYPAPPLLAWLCWVFLVPMAAIGTSMMSSLRERCSLLVQLSLGLAIICMCAFVWVPNQQGSFALLTEALAAGVGTNASFVQLRLVSAACVPPLITTFTVVVGKVLYQVRLQRWSGQLHSWLHPLPRAQFHS